MVPVSGFIQPIGVAGVAEDDEVGREGPGPLVRGREVHADLLQSPARGTGSPKIEHEEYLKKFSCGKLEGRPAAARAARA